MSVCWRGHFQVPTPLAADEYIEDVISELDLVFTRLEVGKLSRSENTIWFRRGFDLGRFKRNYLQAFDPGAITIQSEGRFLRVDYALGMFPGYSAILGVIIVAVGFLVAPFILAVTMTLGLGAVLFCGLSFAAWRVRVLLRETVADAIASGSHQQV